MLCFTKAAAVKVLAMPAPSLNESLPQTGGNAYRRDRLGAFLDGTDTTVAPADVPARPSQRGDLVHASMPSPRIDAGPGYFSSSGRPGKRGGRTRLLRRRVRMKLKRNRK